MGPARLACFTGPCPRTRPSGARQHSSTGGTITRRAGEDGAVDAREVRRELVDGHKCEEHRLQTFEEPQSVERDSCDRTVFLCATLPKSHDLTFHKSHQGAMGGEQLGRGAMSRGQNVALRWEPRVHSTRPCCALAKQRRTAGGCGRYVATPPFPGLNPEGEGVRRLLVSWM